MSDGEKFTSSGRGHRRVCRRVIVSCVMLLLVSACLVYGYMSYRMHHCIETILPGRLYRSSELTPHVLAEKAARLGVATVVDLRDPVLDDGIRDPVGMMRKKIEGERSAMEARGIRHIMVSSEQIPDSEIIEAFLSVIDRYGSQPVLIHCDHGIGRTGVFVAIYLIEYAGHTNEEALRCVSRYYSLRPGGRRNFRLDRGKGSFIMDYVKRPASTGPVSGPASSDDKDSVPF